MNTLSQRPIKLLNNRVWRTYTGGRSIEKWQSQPDPCDSEFPEEWVASTVKARNVGREYVHDEGLSRFLTTDNLTMTLKEIIEADAEAFLGKHHVQKYGSNLAVLVKVLDSSERLTIQVHPDRDFAQRTFASNFGKTEAWFILGGRTIDGVKPQLHLGFKPGVTKEKWSDLFQNQDIDGMLDSLHVITPETGDVYLVEGGVPHAIGSGCFMIEIQEPTDLTYRVERTTPSNKPIPDMACHLGTGFETMLDCFHYEPFTLEETLQRWRINPRVIHQDQFCKEIERIGPKHTSSFRMHSIHVSLSYRQHFDTFAIAIILSGQGSIHWQGSSMNIEAAEQVFIPIETGPIEWKNSGNTELEIILCFPPYIPATD